MMRPAAHERHLGQQLSERVRDRGDHRQKQHQNLNRQNHEPTGRG